jgi:PIN domain nuclease of toxin-antitoxin system
VRLLLDTHAFLWFITMYFGTGDNVWREKP